MLFTLRCSATGSRSRKPLSSRRPIWPVKRVCRWVETGVDTDQLAQRMLDEGYLLAPGALFHAARAPTTLMRINFATTQDAAFWAVLTKQIAAMSR